MSGRRTAVDCAFARAARDGDKQRVINSGWRRGRRGDRVDAVELQGLFGTAMQALGLPSLRGANEALLGEHKVVALSAHLTRRLLGDHSDPIMHIVDRFEPVIDEHVGCAGTMKQRIITELTRGLIEMVRALFSGVNKRRQQVWEELVPPAIREELQVRSCAITKPNSIEQEVLLEYLDALLAMCLEAIHKQEYVSSRIARDALQLLNAGLIPLFWRRNEHNERELVIWRLP